MNPCGYLGNPVKECTRSRIMITLCRILKGH